MTDWTAGYIADIGYTFGYYTELNPLRAQFALLYGGFAPPAGSACCELGFGQGVSVNVHAAASGSEWWATDFNPTQASFARELASVSGASANLSDESFEEFCRRQDLPDFDFIGLHGIWSWVSDKNRQVIVDFIRRKLKVGGVVYVSYNTQPGWAPMIPIRDLLTDHRDSMTAEGSGSVAQVGAALEFIERLLDVNPTYAKVNPLIVERIKQIKTQNRNYLAHEYFNRDWAPMSFSRMASWLDSAKISFAVSAAYLEQLDPMNLTKEQVAMLKEIADPVLRNTTRDFIVNQQFRRDYWVKGARKLLPLQQIEHLRRLRFQLVNFVSDVTLKAVGSLGEVNLAEPIYAAVLESLADYKAKSLHQIELDCQRKQVSFGHVLQALLVLVGKGDVMPAQQDEKQILKSKPSCDKLNARIMSIARETGDIQSLASPVTGGAIGVGRFEQLFLLARQQGHKTPEEWATFVAQLIEGQGQKLIVDGVTLETKDDTLSHLIGQGRMFSEKRLPVLKALLIA